MSFSFSHRNYLEVDLDKIIHNLKEFRKKIPVSTKIMAVIKASGYGSFLSSDFNNSSNTPNQPLIETLLEQGVENFGISTLEEAMLMRKLVSSSKGQLHLLGNLLQENLKGFIDLKVVLPINSYSQFIYFNKLANQLKKPIIAHILIDTGMGLLGIPHFEAKKMLEKILAPQKFLKVTGIFSHFSNANELNDSHTLKQIERFQEIVELSKQISSTPLTYHLANSWGTGNYPQSHYDMVRLGVGLYGIQEQIPPGLNLKSTVSLKSRLIEKRKLPKGFTISYNLKYSLPKETWVGTVSSGYADGIPLGLGMLKKNQKNKGEVLILGKRIPVIGKITMDYFMVDLSSIPQVKVGEKVTIFGEDKKEFISVVDFAKRKGPSHSYDVICSVGSRVPRVFLSRKKKNNK